MTRGRFCLSQPPPVPRDVTELGAVGLQPSRTSRAVVPLEGTAAISLFLGGKALQISLGVVRQRLWHLPAEVVAGGWLRHREPCRRNRLSSSCPPCEHHPTPPQTWMHRTASSCPPLCFPRRFVAHPSARYRLDKSKAAQRPSIPCGCYLPGAALRTSLELAGGGQGSAWSKASWEPRDCSNTVP